ncbi:MAG TPA: T9SS type A sorting domain-containing protein, partial [Chitinophagaceae bacterium]|nr:T9SS type A sorting domain-containing protein [Chitinophagaceae bacterium]
LTAPDFRPFAGSPALSGASFSHVGLNDPFFTPTSYVGAMSASQLSNWAVIWVNWNPAKADYSGACPCAANAAAATVTEDNAVSAVIPETSLYPNPSKGVFNVNVSGFKGTVTIKVTNMNGASVYTATQNVNGKSTVKVNLSNATAGLYFVSVTDGKQTITQKMNIVQ